MNYTIDFTDPLRSSFQIPAKGLDGPGAPIANSTLRLYGEGALKWGESVDENMLQSLENHAGATEPLFSVPGQLWVRQALYWRDTSINMPSTGAAPAGAVLRWNFSQQKWEQFAINAVSTLPATGTSVGAYVIIPNGTIYRWDRPFQQAELQWMPRTVTTKNRAPGTSEKPVEELLVKTISGWVNAGGLTMNVAELSVDLNTLGGPSDAGLYFAGKDATATLALNYPVAEAGSLFVTLGAWNGCQQMYITRTNRIFLRALTANWNFTNGPWGSWLELNDFNSMRNKPTTFPPGPHTHPISDVVNLQAALAAKQDKLNYVPVNKAGDNMTGALSSTAKIATIDHFVAGQDWGAGSTGTMINDSSIWFGNSTNRFRWYKEDNKFGLAQYSSSDAWQKSWIICDGDNTMNIYANIVGSANVTAWSDSRLKTSITRLVDGDVVDLLEPVVFEWAAHELVADCKVGATDAGFRAEQVDVLLPHLVVKTRVGDETYLSVDYARLAPHLVAKIQSQSAEIKSLRAEIDHIKDVLDRLVGDNK